MQATIIDRYYESFNRRDFASYDRLFTPDCKIEAPGVELSGIEGARAFDKVWQTAIPDAKIVNLHKTESGRMVMCENRIAGMHTGPLITAEGTIHASGKRFDEAYMAAFEIEGERIKRQTLHFDRLAVMMKLGPNHVAAVQGIYAAFGAGNVQAILDACADDVSWGIDSLATEVPPYGIRTGKPGVATFAAAWAENVDFHTFAASDFVPMGDHVFCTLSYELTVKATGKRLKTTSAQQWSFANGKVVRWRGYEDTAATRDAFRR
jgi:ketosteroid isomerase-like protein